MSFSNRRELEALKREVDLLRAERRDALAGAASQFGIDTEQRAPDEREERKEREENSEGGFVVDWKELGQLAHEVADELGQATRDHPALGIGGAFVLGLMVGRILAR